MRIMLLLLSVMIIGLSSCIDITESEVSIDYLDELIEYTKTKIKAEAKIESLIQKIIDICDDYQLNLDDYIEITNYDMDFEGLD